MKIVIIRDKTDKEYFKAFIIDNAGYLKLRRAGTYAYRVDKCNRIVGSMPAKEYIDYKHNHDDYQDYEIIEFSKSPILTKLREAVK